MTSRKTQRMRELKEIEPAIDAAVLLLHRRGNIRRCEARLAIYDYLGLQRNELCEQLNVAPGTLDKYWTRIYVATGRQGRKAAREWVEQILVQATARKALPAPP